MKRFWKFIESLIPEPSQAKYSYKLVLPDHKFICYGLCPYCSGNLTYVITEWVIDDNGLWEVMALEPECWNEPDILDESEVWEMWFKDHSYYPYTYQLPIDERVKIEINKSYRFILS